MLFRSGKTISWAVEGNGDGIFKWIGIDLGDFDATLPAIQFRRAMEDSYRHKLGVERLAAKVAVV